MLIFIINEGFEFDLCGRDSLKKGDKVVTAGGIYGTVAEIEEKTVLLKVDGEVKLRVDKNSLSRDFSANAQ